MRFHRSSGSARIFLTAYVVSAELERGSVTLDEPVMVSEAAQAMQGSRMFIEANKVVALGDLMRGLIIQSGNDASVALAEHIAASEPGFVDMMNRTAELGMRLVSIVMGAASDKARIAESQRLLNYGFRFFRTQRVYAAGESISQARVWMGRQDQVGLGVAEDLYLTLPRDSFEKLTTEIEVNEYVRAPMRLGEQLGRSVLKLDGQIISDVPLLALQQIEEGGMFKRMRHSIQRMFQ